MTDHIDLFHMRKKDLCLYGPFVVVAGWRKQPFAPSKGVCYRSAPCVTLGRLLIGLRAMSTISWPWLVDSRLVMGFLAFMLWTLVVGGRWHGSRGMARPFPEPDPWGWVSSSNPSRARIQTY